MTEMTEVFERPTVAADPSDRSPELVALGAFAAVVLIGVVLVLIRFEVPAIVTKVAPWALAIAAILYMRFSVPSEKLLPARRAQRDARRAGATVGVLSGMTMLCAVAAAQYLTSWSQWLVLGSYVGVAVGIGLMLHVHLSIGA